MLGVDVRSGWTSLNNRTELEPEEYRILLTTGGPACQILGDLNTHCEPCSADLQYQDWFKPWVDLPLSDEEAATLVTFARCFYFGG